MPVRNLNIVIVEDNDDLRWGWMGFFERNGHHVKAVALAEELLEVSGLFHPDVYLIDLNLPDGDGLDLVAQLRKVHPNVGIIIITARTQLGDKVLGYNSGADIYFSKPVDPEELLAGISSLTKRRQSVDGAEQLLFLRLREHQLHGPLSTVSLTPHETALLSGLVRASGTPLARWQLAELLGSRSDLPSDAMLEMRIARLRKRLFAAGAPPPAIRALHKQGYVLSCTVILN